jgi:hypothetical protein
MTERRRKFPQRSSRRLGWSDRSSRYYKGEAASATCLPPLRPYCSKCSKHFEIRFAELAKERREDWVLEFQSFPVSYLAPWSWTPQGRPKSST